MEIIDNFRYKLHFFAVEIDGPLEVLCDNKSVVTNSSVPELILSHFQNYICYHRVREAQSCGRIAYQWIPGYKNFANFYFKD